MENTLRNLSYNSNFATVRQLTRFFGCLTVFLVVSLFIIHRRCASEKTSHLKHDILRPPFHPFLLPSKCSLQFAKSYSNFEHERKILNPKFRNSHRSQQQKKKNIVWDTGFRIMNAPRTFCIFSVFAHYNGFGHVVWVRGVGGVWGYQSRLDRFNLGICQIKNSG